MVRLFEQHRVRNTYEINGLWECKIDGKEYKIPVPGCWEQHPDLMNYRGVAEYKRVVYCRKTGNIRLEFKGVSHTADVYFDGCPVAHHYNAYTPFSVVIPCVEKGEHIITVKVDNTFSEASSLHIPNDYYTYGGITRPVSMEEIPNVYIKKVHFTPYSDSGKWCGRIETEIENLSDNSIETELSVKLADTAFAEEFYIEAHSTKKVIIDSAFEDVTPWSNAMPVLYMLETKLSVLGDVIDDLIDRVGFRIIEVKGTKIYLNGDEIFLKGFNRHENYAVDGIAVSLQHIVQDMDLMQDMGVNALRTCHYPNDERMLDLCDERGIMVWEENHARGLDIQRMKNPNFEKQCEDCNYEMVEYHYNHPSIIVWGILNECASEDEEGRLMYKKQYEQIRKLDSTRPMTSASCRHFTDISLDMPDIISWNFYNGWYTDDDIEEKKEEIIKWSYETVGKQKPVIMSEFGAGAIYGYRDRSECKWSEEFQAKLLEESLKIYMNDEKISGVFIWQFADCRVTQEEWFGTRARCHNNKGVVDEYRRPKMAYDVVKNMFKSIK